MRRAIIIIYAIGAILLIASCASRGSGPQGGPKDTTPPRVVKYSPAEGCTNMKRKRIEITFDEIVVLKDASKKIVISPPQRVPADTKAISHKVVVEFMDSLLDSTTYSIDFTDAIVDNNEGNKLEGFTYSFSTGDYIDSMQISGRVISAESLNPVSGIFVGVHSNQSDTAFTHTALARITKTNDKGEYCIKNLPNSTFHIFALKDLGGNYIKDMPGEEIAFLDTAFTPTRTVTIHRDTIFNAKDTAAIDTIITHKEVSCTPTDVLLRSFTEQDTRHYLAKTARPERHRMQLLFNGKADTLPKLTPLNIDSSTFKAIIIPNATYDTITYWLPDTAIWRQDTLQFLLSYNRIETDTSYLTNDTIQFVFRHAKNNSSTKAGNKQKQKPGKKKEEKTSRQQNPKLISTNATNTFDIYRPLEIKFEMPTELNPHDTVGYQLYELVDTVLTPIPNSRLRQKDSSGTLYLLEYKWKPATSYQLVIDSSLCRNMIHQTNDREVIQIKTKSLEEYSKLILHLTNIHGNEVVQLLNDKDQMVRQIALRDTSKTKEDVVFEYVTPGVYFMRLYQDINQDGVWTPGLYSEHRQPEPVVYFPYDIELRAFWDVEEDWDPTTTPLAKPQELIKVEGDEEKKN